MLEKCNGFDKIKNKDFLNEPERRGYQLLSGYGKI